MTALYVSGMTGTIHLTETCTTGRGRAFGNVRSTDDAAAAAHHWAKGCKRCGSAAIVEAAGGGAGFATLLKQKQTRDLGDTTGTAVGSPERRSAGAIKAARTRAANKAAGARS